MFSLSWLCGFLPLNLNKWDLRAVTLSSFGTRAAYRIPSGKLLSLNVQLTPDQRSQNRGKRESGIPTLQSASCPFNMQPPLKTAVFEVRFVLLQTVGYQPEGSFAPWL